MTSQGLAESLEFLRSLDLPAGEYAIFGSGPLAVRGIIEHSHDLDVICRGAAWEQVRAAGRMRYLEEYDVQIVEFLDGSITFGQHWGIGDVSVDALIDTAEILDGLPFVRVEYVVDYKRIANRPKDKEHLRAWYSYTSNVS